MANKNFNYSRSAEATNFSFFRIPRALVKDERFRDLPTDSKLLYGLMLDRMGLSSRNGWHDDVGRVYIYCTVKEVCETMGCGRNKAMRLLAELDTNKGIGLIERIRQGQGKPDRIFVKRITVQEDIETPVTSSTGPTAPISEADFSDVQKSENPTSSNRENRPLEVSKNDPNKTYINQTYFIQTNLSIYLSAKPTADKMDGSIRTKGESMPSYLIKDKPNSKSPTWRQHADNAASGAVQASMSSGSTDDYCKGRAPLNPGAQKCVSP